MTVVVVINAEHIHCFVLAKHPQVETGTPFLEAGFSMASIESS